MIRELNNVLSPITKPLRMAAGWGTRLGKEIGISCAKEYGPWITRKKSSEIVKNKPGIKGSKGI